MGEGMNGQAKILAAFWNRNQARFCELTAAEIKLRSGHEITGEHGRALMNSRKVTYDVLPSHSTRIYRLTRDGEAQVSAMVVNGTLPKLMVRLTAFPPDEGRKNNRRA